MSASCVQSQEQATHGKTTFCFVLFSQRHRKGSLNTPIPPYTWEEHETHSKSNLCFEETEVPKTLVFWEFFFPTDTENLPSHKSIPGPRSDTEDRLGEGNMVK